MSTPEPLTEAEPSGSRDPSPDAPTNGGGYARLPRAKDATAEDVARAIGSGLGAGLRRASRAFEGGEVSALLGDANLPEVHSEDPLAELATRVDREADLWRNLALRQMTRTTFTDRIVQAAAAVALLGQLGIAVVAGLGVLFGGEGAGMRALLALAASAALALGAGIVAWAAAGVRRNQRAIAQDALARADLAELRLHRLALTLTWRSVEPSRLGEALTRLERDASR